MENERECQLRARLSADRRTGEAEKPDANKERRQENATENGRQAWEPLSGMFPKGAWGSSGAPHGFCFIAAIQHEPLVLHAMLTQET